MRIRPSYFSLALCAVLLMAWIAALGCHRSYYRRQADCDARSLILEKMNDPRWSQIDPSINISPESRMYDQFSADHPPMPNDDRASHELMHCVDDKPGYQHWHVNGDTTYVANPEWRAYLPLDQDGVLTLDLQTSVTLSLIHSDQLQQQRENLYQSALVVSLERFGFDLQAFHDWSGFFNTAGEFSGGETSLTSDSNTTLRKLSINGASFVVGLANSIMWTFNGPDTTSANSLINFSFVQPLLRGAARQIVMENLTQAERDLLADVRQLERFRRGFNLSVTTGRSAGAGPGSNPLIEPSRAGSLAAGGFLGLLQTRQEIRILEFNVQSLENVLNQFREYFDEQRINLFQVRLAESSLLNAQDRLLRLRVRYRDDLDQFKRVLGLPPDLPIEIDDPFLDQFELVDDELLERQLQVNLLRDELGALLAQLTPDADEGFSDDQELEWNDDLEQALLSLLPAFAKLDPFFEKLQGPDRELVEKDFDKLESVTDERLQELAELRTFVSEGDSIYDIEPSILAPESIVPAGQLRNELTELQQRINLLKGTAMSVVDEIQSLSEEGPDLTSDELKERLAEKIVFDAPEIVTKMADVVIELTLMQARARTSSISLPPVELDSDAAWSIACQFRRDLMNARAALVNQWRQIEIAADDLESRLDIVSSGSVGTTNDNLFGFDWRTNQFRLGLEWDAPITRLAERNVYRRTLINYQRARRDYYNFEDSIKQNLRQTLRAIDQSRVVFELNRRGIGVAVESVELARFDLIRPVPPGQGGGRQGTTLGPTAARDLTNALNDLQNEQTRFLGVWVSYEVARRGLDFDLGTMQLTPEGFWLDPGTINEEYAYRAAEAFGIPAESICLPPEIQFVDPQEQPEDMAPGEALPIEEMQPETPENFDATPEPSLEPPAEGDQARMRGLFGPVLQNTGFGK